MRYNDLKFPKAMNLDTLSEILSDDQMMSLIKKYESEERRERRIILPSRKLIRKCVIYYYAKKHGEDFDQVLRELKEKGIEERKDKIIELFRQRKKEIKKEEKV